MGTEEMSLSPHCRYRRNFHTIIHRMDSEQPNVEQAPAPSKPDGAAPTEPPSLLNARICDLGLTIEGSGVDRFVQQLYRELEDKRIMKFRPVCYLTDEWGCPPADQTIGIPFYLARPDLARMGVENKDFEEIGELRKYFRHGRGHGSN